MDYFDLYKELYYKEEENRAQLSNKITPSITFLMAFVSGQAWAISEGTSKTYTNEIHELVGNSLLITGSLFIVFSMYWFCLTYFFYGHCRAEIADIYEFQRWEEENAGHPDIKDAKCILREKLASLYRDCAINNQIENDKKAKWQHRLFCLYLVFFVILILEYLWITLM